MLSWKIKRSSLPLQLSKRSQRQVMVHHSPVIHPEDTHRVGNALSELSKHRKTLLSLVPEFCFYFGGWEERTHELVFKWEITLLVVVKKVPFSFFWEYKCLINRDVPDYKLHSKRHWSGQCCIFKTELRPARIPFFFPSVSWILSDNRKTGTEEKSTPTFRGDQL